MQLVLSASQIYYTASIATQQWLLLDILCSLISLEIYATLFGMYLLQYESLEENGAEKWKQIASLGCSFYQPITKQTSAKEKKSLVAVEDLKAEVLTGVQK